MKGEICNQAIWDDDGYMARCVKKKGVHKHPSAREMVTKLTGKLIMAPYTGHERIFPKEMN